MTSTPAPETRPPITGLSMDSGALYVEGPTLDRISRKRVSPSTANAMFGCVARWAGEKALAPEADLFGPAELGTGAHTVLEDLYGLEPEDRTNAAAMSSLLRLARKTFPDDELRRQMWLTEVAGKYRGIFDMEKPADINVIATEANINDVSIGGIPFNGVIDRVERTSDGRVKIVDYKTGRFKTVKPEYRDDYGEQMRLYALAWLAKHGETAKLAYLYYTAEGKKRQIAIAKKTLKKTEQDFVSAGERLFEYQETGRFPVKPGPLCGWCPLVNICPAAAADGRGARSRVPSADELADITLVSSEAVQGKTVEAEAEDSSSDTDCETPTSKEDAVEINLTDDKPWHDMPLGAFNLSSYAATAVFGTVNLAYQTLRKSAEAETNVDTIRALSQIFADIILGVQERMVGDSAGWQEGSNTRVRGVLHSLVEQTPPPFGADAEEWEAWISQTTEQTAFLASTAVFLYHDQLPDTDHAIAVLTGADPDDEEDEAVADEDSEDELDSDDVEIVDEYVDPYEPA